VTARTRPVVVLLDLDGTLLTTHGAGRRAVADAFDRVLARPDAAGTFPYGGLTDPAIFRRGAEAVGHALTPALHAALQDAYLEALARRLEEPPGVRALPGAVAFAETLLARPGVATGVGTGNVRRGAQLKLRAIGLERRFDFGGYGCDAEDRAELLELAARRGAAALGVPRLECHVVVVGDTPRDVSAAHAIGAVCLAVTTGGIDAETLRASGADAVVPDLEGDHARAAYEALEAG
jgi:phosphoglycolate phosphatase-like HAD superfamily hydrolase